MMNGIIGAHQPRILGTMVHQSKNSMSMDKFSKDEDTPIRTQSKVLTQFISLKEVERFEDNTHNLRILASHGSRAHEEDKEGHNSNIYSLQGKSKLSPVKVPSLANLPPFLNNNKGLNSNTNNSG